MAIKDRNQNNILIFLVEALSLNGKTNILNIKNYRKENKYKMSTNFVNSLRYDLFYHNYLSLTMKDINFYKMKNISNTTFLFLRVTKRMCTIL